MSGDENTPLSGEVPHNGVETSREAAEAMTPARVGKLERAVYGQLASRAPGGMTCDELEELLELTHQTCSARVRGLAKRGLISDSGARRPTRYGRRAIVWQVVRPTT